MATQQLDYTAKSGRSSYSVDLTLTYADTANKDGSYDVTDATGTYTVTKTAGQGEKATTSTVSYDITKLEKPHHVGNNDNKIYLDGTRTLFDLRGVTFYVDEATGKRPHKSEKVNLFYHPSNKSISQYSNGATSVTSLDPKMTDTTSFASTEAAAPLAATCYAAGTHIATARGDVAVEALVVGDRVVTTSGVRRAVRWLGHRDVDCRRHPCRAAVLPIRIAAHAFGENRPSRDLVVSPGHSICVDLMGEDADPGRRARQRHDDHADRSGERAILARRARQPRRHPRREPAYRKLSRDGQQGLLRRERPRRAGRDPRRESRHPRRLLPPVPCRRPGRRGPYAAASPLGRSERRGRAEAA